MGPCQGKGNADYQSSVAFLVAKELSKQGTKSNPREVSTLEIALLRYFLVFLNNLDGCFAITMSIQIKGAVAPYPLETPIRIHVWVDD